MADAPRQLSPTDNALGLAGFITSIVGILSCGLLSPIGLILSFIGLFKRPRGFAIAGTIIGFVGSIGILIVILAVGLVVIGVGLAAAAAGPGGREMFFDTIVISAQLEEYRHRNASLPATLAQLPHVTADQLKDHWGHEYIYKPDLVSNKFKIISMGADGVEGTSDDMTFTGDSFEVGTTHSQP